MNSQNYHFIVADDDERARYLIEFVLRRTFPDAILFCFLDGDEALECFVRHGADAVITDQCMPRLCGADLIRAIKRRDPSTPAIMVSNSPDARAQGFAAGVDRYLDKGEAIRWLPLVLTELLADRKPAYSTAAVSGQQPVELPRFLKV